MSPDPLEAELKGMYPREVSADLRRLPGRLREGGLGSKCWRSRRRIAVVCAVAVCTTALVLTLRGPDEELPPRAVQPEPELPVLVVTPRVEPALPTLGAYQRAFADSPEAFDALLDERLGVAAGDGQFPDGSRATTTAGSALLAWTGDPR